MKLGVAYSRVLDQAEHCWDGGSGSGASTAHAGLAQMVSEVTGYQTEIGGFLKSQAKHQGCDTFRKQVGPLAVQTYRGLLKGESSSLQWMGDLLCLKAGDSMSGALWSHLIPRISIGSL